MRMRLLLVCVLVILTGCDAILPFELAPTRELPSTETLSQPTPISTPTPPLTPAPSGPTTLTLWLPPQFNPESGNPIGNLLKSRLLQFTRARSDITIEVRIKDVEGPGGILDTLATAAQAAQTALPDLVILPHDHLQEVVSEGLVNPFDNLSTTLDDPDWYNFGRELAYIQGKIYGLPFAADAMIQVYNPEKIEVPAFDSATVLTATSPIIFPAADPRALYTLALYQSEGGALVDEQDHPYLDLEKLTNVLAFFQQANSTGSMPYWLTSYQEDQQAWDGFLEGRGEHVITWLSRYLDNGSNTTSNRPVAMGPIPTINGTTYSLAEGWVWALTSPDPSKHPPSVQLAEFLTESAFLSEWTATMNLLPARPSALRSWDKQEYPWIDPEFITRLDSTAQSLHPYPQYELGDMVSKILEKATVDVFKGQASPEEAANQAVSELE